MGNGDGDRTKQDGSVEHIKGRRSAQLHPQTHKPPKEVRKLHCELEGGIAIIGRRKPLRFGRARGRSPSRHAPQSPPPAPPTANNKPLGGCRLSRQQRWQHNNNDGKQ